MSQTVHLESHRGETVTITFPIENFVLTGMALRWTLKDAPDGTTLLTKTTGDGLTIDSATQATGVLPSANLDIAVGVYYHSLVCTTPGYETVLNDGRYTLKPPRAT